MDMKPQLSMRQKMLPLRLYDLQKSGSLAGAEVDACADALQAAYDALLTCEAEAFLASAQSWGLAGAAGALGTADGGTLCRGTALFLQGTAAHRCGRAAFLQLARALGLDGPLYEDPAGQQVLFCAQKEPEQTAFLVRMLRQMLPAQLAGAIDLRGQESAWATLDSAGLSFAQLDARALPWSTLDGTQIYF
ncbi:MAG: hypothetical protein LKE53_09235 [Oscillospiraceae bacterium]|jgi:hypothetical protein|nr:hypothetical protein [Oscillospiraceae bacterium]